MDLRARWSPRRARCVRPPDDLAAARRAAAGRAVANTGDQPVDQVGRVSLARAGGSPPPQRRWRVAGITLASRDVEPHLTRVASQSLTAHHPGVPGTPPPRRRLPPALAPHQLNHADGTAPAGPARPITTDQTARTGATGPRRHATRAAYNPSVVGSSPTRPTAKPQIRGHISGSDRGIRTPGPRSCSQIAHT